MRALRIACLVAAAIASLATSAPRGFRAYPEWRPHRMNRVVGASVVSVWAPRSGREGVGILVQVRTSNDPGVSGDTVVDSEATSLELGRRRMRPDRVVPAGAARTYLVFRFDGLEAWNSGHRTARLRLGLRTGQASRSLLVELGQSRLWPHSPREIRRARP